MPNDRTTPNRREIVAAARKLHELLTPREHWTKGALARGANRREVKPEQPEAKCWCLLGGIEHILPFKGKLTPAQVTRRIILRKRLREMLAAEIEKIAPKMRRHCDPDFTVFKFNDNRVRAHADIVDLTARIIERAAA